MGRKDPFRWSVGLHRRPILDFQTVPRDCQILDTRQPPDHQSAHGGVDERFACGTQPLVVLTHAAVLPPSEGAFYDTAQATVSYAEFPTYSHLSGACGTTLMYAANVSGSGRMNE